MQDMYRTKYKTHCKSSLTLPDGEEIFVLERPWLNNKSFVSCVPADQYIVTPNKTGKFKYYELLGTLPRTSIEIHPANWVDELAGCLAPCMEFNDKSVTAIRSVEACELLQRWYGDSDWVLNIIEVN